MVCRQKGSLTSSGEWTAWGAKDDKAGQVMEKWFLLPLVFFLLLIPSCREGSDSRAYYDIDPREKADTLFRVYKGTVYEPGLPCGYVNSKGDTVIPVGRYVLCFSEKITTFGIVMTETDSGFEWIGINRDGKRLYEVYPYDNGPDYMADGLFRILRNGKIGYADSSGRVVIKPRYACAEPFGNGRARVAFQCNRRDADGDGHVTVDGADWFYIDRGGNRIPSVKSVPIKQE